MSNEEFNRDFSKYIENKINTRNKNAINTPRNDALVDFLDREITFLENCELFVSSIRYEFEKKLAQNGAKRFKDGQDAQYLKDRTNRDHKKFF